MAQLIDRPWRPGDTITHPTEGAIEIVLVELCEGQAAFEARGWRLKKLTRKEAIAKIRKWVPGGFDVCRVINGITLVHCASGRLVAEFSFDTEPVYEVYDLKLWEKIPDVVGRIWMQVEV